MIIQSYVKNMGEFSEVIILSESGQEIGKIIVEESIAKIWNGKNFEVPMYKMFGESIDSEEFPANKFGCKF
jgi:hypothetical protein